MPIYDNFFGELEKANSPSEMRQAIIKIARDNAQVRQILEHGRYYGLSGEDTYVFLAYELLRENIKFKELAMKELRCSVNKQIVI